ncbi:MAG: O-antigen ligase family protein, partial [Coriobacteriia bacterium]
MAKRRVGKGIVEANAARNDDRGRAYAVGRGFFVALVAVTPLIMGSLPGKWGPIAQFGTYDMVALPKIVAILMLSGLSLLALCVSVVRGESELYWHPAMWILLGLLGWAGVSTLLSASPAHALLGSYSSYDGLAAILGYVLVAFLAIQYVRSTRALRVVAMTAVVSGSIVAGYALLQFWGLDPYVYKGGFDRVISTYGNADMLGDYLVFPFALALGLALSTPGRWSASRWWLASALIASALLASGTRGAWLGAIALVLSIGLPSWRSILNASPYKKVVLGGIVAAVTAIAVLLIAYFRPLVGRTLVWSEGLSKFSNGRSVIWLTGLRGWLLHPITGWGPEGFARAFGFAAGPDWYAIIEGLQRAENAHNFLLQTLVTLGIPGLVLTVWALVYTGILSFRGTRSTEGRPRVLLLAIWGALVGLIVAMFFGVALPPVAVWLWATVGLLLAPIAHRVSAPPRAVLAGGAALGVAVAVWAGSWLVADVVMGSAQQQLPGPDQVLLLETATRINPISPDYRWLFAEALVSQAVAGRSAGASPQFVDATLRRGIAAFYVAAQADRGDAMVRVALSNTLLRHAAQDPTGNSAQQAVQVAQEAVRLAPRNPAALAALAMAYRAVGRLDEAEKTAQLAREVAPEYSRQTLG